MMPIQLPTGKTAWVDAGWWFGLSDDQVKQFFEGNQGSDLDPMETGIPLPGIDTENSQIDDE